MGYSVTLYLGNAWTINSLRDDIKNSKSETMESFEQVASMALCSVDGSLHKLMKEMPTSRYYIWQRSDDIEDEPQVTDVCYGDFKMFVGNDVKRLYGLIMEEQAKDIDDYDGAQGYRRYDMVLSMLRHLLDHFDNPIVIWYGS